jgi:hypothetical protein
MFPDFAVFECAGCHRAMGAGGKGGGALRPDLSHLRMLEVVAERCAPAQAAVLAGHRAALERATTKRALADEFAASQPGVAAVLEACSARKLDSGDARVWLERLLRNARGGEFAAHPSAEQATYALGTLLASLPDLQKRPGVEAALEALYDEAGKPGSFDAGRWQRSVQQFGDKLGVK